MATEKQIAANRENAKKVPVPELKMANGAEHRSRQAATSRLVGPCRSKTPMADDQNALR